MFAFKARALKSKEYIVVDSMYAYDTEIHISEIKVT